MKKLKCLWGLCLLSLLVSIIFIVPLVPMVGDKVVSASFLPDKGADTAIVFFGYSRCGDTCPTSMMMLEDVLTKSQALENWPVVVFVEIDTTSDAKKALAYAKNFHPQFLGYFPSASELKQYSQQFGLNFQQVGSKITHRGRTYLLRRRGEIWHLEKAYNPKGFTAALLKNEF